MRRTSTVADHTDFLFSRFVVPYYILGAKEVHLIYDKPCKQPFDPKIFERAKRDTNKFNKQHQCMAFTPTSKMPSNWGDYIACCTCKRSIIEAIGLLYLQTTRHRLRSGQCLVMAGCFGGQGEDNAIVMSGDERQLPQHDNRYDTDGEESDIRIWRHVKQSTATSILIYSPDTDVYNIGIGIYEEVSKDVIVQVNVASKEQKYIYI